MSQKALYQLEVAPLTLVGLRHSPFFSYVSLVPVGEGSLIRISFGRQHIQGIVFECHPLSGKPPTWMKMIEKVEVEKLLTKEQRHLALFLSKTYFTPLGNCLKHFLSPRLKRAVVQKEKKYLSSPLPALSREEKKTLSLLLKKSRKPILFSASRFSFTRNILLSFLLKKKKEGKTVLLLVPELSLALWWEEELLPFLRESLALIHSKKKGSDLAHLSEDIRLGKKKIILGTRQALFAPFRDLDTILVLDEEDETSYKQWEMSPRYTTRSVVQELAHLFKSRIILVSPTPSLTSFFSIQNKNLTFLQSKEKIERSSLLLANMRFEKRKRRGETLLSEPLIEEMKRTLEKGSRIFLIGKQAGFSSLSLCRKCRTVLRCPNCSKALSEEVTGRFLCLSCGYKASVFPRCSHCEEMSFESWGGGTEKIERAVQMYFPRARILRFDRRTLEKRRDLEETVRSLREGKFDVLIGTHTLAKVPNLPKTSLIAMIQADSLLSFPEYQAEEKLLSVIERLRLLASSERNSLLLIQTFDPESLFFRELDKPFFEKEKLLFEERRLFGYPPVLRFFKIECRGKTKDLSRKTANTMLAALTPLIEKEKLPLTIIPPHLPLSLLKQKHFQFFLRFPPSFSFPRSLRLWCERFSSQATFDLDPLNLN